MTSIKVGSDGILELQSKFKPNIDELEQLLVRVSEIENNLDSRVLERGAAGSIAALKAKIQETITAMNLNNNGLTRCLSSFEATDSLLANSMKGVSYLAAALATGGISVAALNMISQMLGVDVLTLGALFGFDANIEKLYTTLIPLINDKYDALKNNSVVGNVFDKIGLKGTVGLAALVGLTLGPGALVAADILLDNKSRVDLYADGKYNVGEGYIDASGKVGFDMSLLGTDTISVFNIENDKGCLKTDINLATIDGNLEGILRIDENGTEIKLDAEVSAKAISGVFEAKYNVNDDITVGIDANGEAFSLGADAGVEYINTETVRAEKVHAGFEANIVKGDISPVFEMSDGTRATFNIGGSIGASAGFAYERRIDADNGIVRLGLGGDLGLGVDVGMELKTDNEQVKSALKAYNCFTEEHPIIYAVLKSISPYSIW